MPQPKWRAMNVIYRHQLAGGPDHAPTVRVLLLHEDLDPLALVGLVNLGFIAVENPTYASSSDRAVGIERAVNHGHTPRPGDRHDPAVCTIGLTPAGVGWISDNWAQQSLLAAHNSAGRRSVQYLVSNGQAYVDGLVAAYVTGLIVAHDAHTNEERPLTNPARDIAQAAKLGEGRPGHLTVRTTRLGRHILGVDE